MSQIKKPKLIKILSWCGVVLGILFVIGFFFIRRSSQPFTPEKSFAVSDPAFFPSALVLGNPLAVSGNKITIYNNGNEIFPALLSAIRDAKESINFEAFLFESGKIGSQFRDAFCERAKAGVEVRVLLDGIGSGIHLKEEDVKIMQDAGCKFYYYHPTRAWRLDRLNRRTHRRNLIIDGRIAFTGGAGFSDLWLGGGEKPEEWRDIHVKVEGPLVASFQSEFAKHWVKESSDVLIGAIFFPVLAPVGNVNAQIVASTEFAYAPLEWALNIAFASADHKLWITNAYCVPSQTQTDLLIAAAARGVDVRLLIPGKHNDQPAAEAAGRPFYEKLVKGGVKIYRYLPSMVHSKTMVADGLFSILGSSNLDPRSMQINEELDLAVYNADFGGQMEAIFLKDLEKSRECTVEEFAERSLWKRIKEFLVGPFRSQV